MHEWALAEAVVAAASEEAEKKGLIEVRKVRIRVGELQHVDLDILKFALSQLRSNKLKKAKFEIDTEKAFLKCRMCGHEWLLGSEKLGEDPSESIHFVPEVAHAYIRCPKCRSPDFEIKEGRGVWLERIEGAK